MANDGTVKIGTEIDESGFKSGLSKLGSVATTALKGGAAIIGGIATAATGAVAGLLALESATEEYRIAQGKLNTAFEAAGYGPEVAAQAYNDFYAILGDTDTATEASQLLAKLSNSAEDVSKWTKIAAGVNGTFGDSLPIEGLIEASNETAKVGQVTGVLADALNWAGISEDDFNSKLEKCSSESERNQLIMDTLSGTYDEASEAFYRNNEALITARENQALLDSTLSSLGSTVSTVKNQLMSEFLPSISNIALAFGDLISGVEGADQELSDAISGFIAVAVEKLPEFLDFGVQIISSIIKGLVGALPSLIEQIPVIIGDFINALAELFPDIVEAGSKILSMLTDGIIEGIPAMLDELPDVIISFLDFITDNLPSILDSGVDVLTSLTDGIIEAIPRFVDRLPEIITSFVNFITENLPKIIEAGITILVNLSSGIIQAIPKLVARLPEIIAAIASGIVNLAASIIQIGANLGGYIKDGIMGLASVFCDAASNIVNWIGNGILSLANNVKDWGGNLVNWIKNGVEKAASSVLSIGKNIVQGLWNGISSMASWIKSKVSGFIGGIVSSVKGVLGIHSPSTVFRDQIGKNIGLGVAEGINDSSKSAKDAMGKMAKDIESAIPDVTMGVQYANSKMVPSSIYPSVDNAYASYSAASDSTILDELRSIRDAVLAGQVLMVDKRVLGQVTASANRTKTRMLGVDTY